MATHRIYGMDGKLGSSLLYDAARLAEENGIDPIPSEGEVIREAHIVGEAHVVVTALRRSSVDEQLRAVGVDVDAVIASLEWRLPHAIPTRPGIQVFFSEPDRHEFSWSPTIDKLEGRAAVLAALEEPHIARASHRSHRRWLRRRLPG